jgi:hypothetical protein
MLIASLWLTPLSVWGILMMEFGIELNSLELKNSNLWKFRIGITSIGSSLKHLQAVGSLL